MKPSPHGRQRTTLRDNRYMTWATLVALLFLCGPNAVANRQKNCSLKASLSDSLEATPTRVPAYSEIRQRIFAVHATNVFPAGKKLIAGAAARADGSIDLTEALPAFRPTLHFSL